MDTSKQIRKLAKYPLSNQELFWFKWYFSDRSQYVKIGNTKSRTIQVSSGVRQGSVNGPLLFITFFDESDPLLYEILALNFADDKKQKQIINCMEDAEDLQKGIDDFMDWCNENRMQVNIGKCKVMTFTKNRNPIVYNHTINGLTIPRVTQTKDPKHLLLE